MPITLEQLARDQGVLFKDKSTPCRAGWQTGSNLTAPNAPNAPNGPKHGHSELPSCVIYFLGAEINTASFAMYTFSISVLIQALLIISMSGAADHGRFRKTFLLAFAFVGATATILFIGVVPKIYLFGALLAIISNTCFGASFVLLNSFLPLLVRYHPSILRIPSPSSPRPSEGGDEYAEQDDHELATSTSGLLSRDHPDATSPSSDSPPAISPELKLSTRISSNGIGIGYIAGLVVQTVAILLVVATGSTTFSLRLVLMVVGLWWFLFTIPAAMWLRPRPGPPLPTALAGNRAWLAYIIYAWKALFKTIGHARKLKDMFIFLCAWFLLSDSIATVSGWVSKNLGRQSQR